MTRTANSHKTYETVCNLHAAWKQWQADRAREGRADRPARTSTEAEEDRQYNIMKTLKRYQEPQVCFEFDRRSFEH
jgi:metacaspase-1